MGGSCDIIAAIATPPGRGGVGIVRVSGVGLADWGPSLIGRAFGVRRATHVRFLDAGGGAIDDGIVLFFAGPHSFTGEDVIELQGHGGPVVSRMLLERVVELGARLAEPGEFTRRAFLNDRMDLAQAEAVADVIDASTEAAVRSAMRSLRGEFSARIGEIGARLTELRMYVEATLDFPEEEIDPADLAALSERLGAVQGLVGAVAQAGRRGSVLRSGLRAVLVGQPNVGKSSVLNRLAGDEVAIVTPVAGTTRDALRELVQIDGVPVHVIDTAGIRDAGDVVERIGIERTWQEVSRGDLVLLVTDAAEGLQQADAEIVDRLPASIPVVTIRNKADLVGEASSRQEGELGPLITLSALTGEGIGLLQEALREIAGWERGGEDTFMARERHLQALGRCANALARARAELERLELCAEELRMAHDALGEITGRITADDLLGEIFSRFCIGK